MLILFRRLAWVGLTLACAATHADAQSRPLAVEDVVRLESFGRASIAPSQRLAVYERRGAYNTAPRYDFGGRSTWAITDLMLIDLDRPLSAPERLLPQEPIGLLRGPWSPSGDRLVVYRFGGGRYEAGIVTLSTRTVAWTGLTPDLPPSGSAVEWASDHEVLLTVRPDGTLPALLRHFGASQERLGVAWDKTRLGQAPSRTVIDADAGVASTEAVKPAQALVLFDTTSGTRRSLAEGPVSDFALSPDRKRVAILEGGDPAPVDADRVVQSDGAVRQRLVLVDLAQGRPDRPLPTFDIAPQLLRWSPDSRSVLVWARPDGSDWTAGRLWVAGDTTPQSLELGELTPGSNADILRGVHADWLGEAPIIYARPTTEQRYDWYTISDHNPPSVLTQALAAAPPSLAAVKSGVAYLFADGGFWSLESDGLNRVAAPGIAPASISDVEQVLRLRGNEAPRRDWTAARGQTGESLVISGTGNVRRLGPGAGPESRILATSEQFALVLTRRGLAETLQLRSADAAYDLDTVNTRFGTVELIQPSAVSHTNALGEPDQSWLFLPPGEDPARIKGVIIEVYPGSVDTGAWGGPFALTYGLRAAVLATAGYAVLTPAIPADLPGTADWAFYEHSVDLAVDATLAAYPDLPRDRMAVLGHSFGGYAALAIATRSTRFKTYVVSSGMTDMFGEWGELIAPTRLLPEDGPMLTMQQGWVEVGQGELQAPPWVDPQAYIARSPFLAANRIHAPVLLLTADKDFVPMSQAERMFSALWRLGGRVRLVSYWGEHHSRWSPANIEDQYHQIFDWLDRTLVNARPAAPASTAAVPTGESSLLSPPGR